MHFREFLNSNFSFLIVFIISAAMILTLAFVNDGSANDDHIEVAQLILEKGKSPEYQDCWQCYHPKLYHHTVARLCSFFKIKKRENRIIVAQIVNAFSSLMTLTLCLFFILKQPFSKTIQILIFSMIAFNPRFIAISAQASNDAFLILFGTIIIYSLYQFVGKPRRRYFLIFLVASTLAGLTKGNAFVLMVGVVSVLLLKMISTRKTETSLTKKYFVSVLLFILFTFLAVGYFGGYFDNYKKYDTPFVYNTPLGEMPHFFEKTNFRRAGVQSISEGYFTFRIFDLIKNPMIKNGYENYPKHRTSVWSQLYGRTHFLYFDNWPPGDWQSKNPRMFHIGRMAFVFALLPTLFWLIGFFKNIKCWLQLFQKRSFDFLNKNRDWVFHVFISVFFAFIILFTLFGRDYSFMKIIYLFPAILAAIIPMMKGFEFAFFYLEKNKILYFVFNVAMVSLFIFYLIPIVNLILKLMNV